MLGIAVAISSNGRPAAKLVLLSGTSSSSTVGAAESISGPDLALASQIAEMSQAIKSRVLALEPDRVVVRRADRAQRPTNLEAPRTRLLVEGAITVVCYEVNSETTLDTGKGLGRAAGLDKTVVDKSALEMLIAESHAQAFGPACAAAIMGLKIA